MTWRLVAPWAGFLKSQKPSIPGRYRPRLDALEDRTVLSPVLFNEVQNQSPLRLSGTIAGQAMQPQGPGALTTTYFGTFQTNIDMVNGTIQFIGTGNDFCAANTGNWAPQADGSDGTAPAIYGVQVAIRGFPFVGAIRDYHMEADTGGAALALYPNADGSFGFASAQTITINAGTGTFSFPARLGSGPINFSGLSATNQAGDGNLVFNGNGTFRVTIPISVSYDTTIGGIRTTLNVDGQIVGDGSFSGSVDGFSNRPAPGGVVVQNLNGVGGISFAAKSVSATGQPGYATTYGAPSQPSFATAYDLGTSAAPAVHLAPLAMSHQPTAQTTDVAFAAPGMESSLDLAAV